MVKLLWIGEFEFARKLIANSEYRSLGSFEEYLFNLVICVQGSGWGGWHFSHPEHNHGVHYGFLYGNEAFKQSSMPLTDLLKMDVPCFSSIDGLVDVKFDKTELERVGTIIPQELQKELRLPLILFGPLGDYPGKYKLVGSKIEEFLLQNLLKLTDASFDKFKENLSYKLFDSISTLNRRKFSSIYKVFFKLEQDELSRVWLNARYDPFWPKSVQASLSNEF